MREVMERERGRERERERGNKKIDQLKGKGGREREGKSKGLSRIFLYMSIPEWTIQDMHLFFIGIYIQSKCVHI